MQEAKSNRKQWFLDRIGKRVYRNLAGCNCVSCLASVEKGLVISDKLHAYALYDYESDLTAEGTPVRYFDTQEEVAIFLGNQ